MRVREVVGCIAFTLALALSGTSIAGAGVAAAQPADRDFHVRKL